MFFFMKKGVAEQVFIYIFALIVMALVLVFGFRSILDIKEKAELTEISKFISNLKDLINTYYNFDVGSSKEIKLNAPSKVNEICFVNPKQEIKGKISDAFFYETLKENTKYNVYILPLDAYPEPAPDFIIEHLEVNEKNNPLCIKTKDGILKAIIETKAKEKYVYVEMREK